MKNITRYFNMRGPYGVETVDELSSDEEGHNFKTRSDFNREINRLVTEYRMGGMPVYTSSRCTKDWRNK